MLTALNKDTNKKVVAARHKSAHELRKKYPLGSLVCPYCHEVLFPRAREGFILHFVHRSACTSSIGRHPESVEHEQGKFVLARYLEQQLKDDESNHAKIEVEYPLTDCGENGRVADVALVYENGNLLICECQLARITPHELEQRTQDYLSVGADVLGFIGKDADTSENRTWLRSIFGSVGRIEFKYDSEQEVFVHEAS
ncbi:MAG: competence protein CoiA family protein [Cyanobacteria bacterium J06554_6]